MDGENTVMVKAPASFLNDTLWPEFQQISSALRTHLDQTTDRILAEALPSDSSDAQEIAPPAQLPAGSLAGEVKTRQGEWLPCTTRATSR
jgi:hypothetical protein